MTSYELGAVSHALRSIADSKAETLAEAIPLALTPAEYMRMCIVLLRHGNHPNADRAITELLRG